MENISMGRLYFLHKLVALDNNIFNKQLRYIRKSTKVSEVVRVKKENKRLFGALIKDKKKEYSAKSQDQDTSVQREKLMETNNTELYWQIKQSGRRLKVYSEKSRTFKKVEADQLIKLIDTSDLVTSCLENSNCITHSELDPKENDTSSQSDRTPQQQNSLKTIQKLPQIIINNITSFPILNRKKKVPNILPTTDILSLSAADDPLSYEYPAVSRILRDTMSKEAQEALEMWKKRMIERLGEEDFNLHVKNQLENGAAFHASVENRLYGRTEEIPKSILPFYESVDGIFKDLGDVKAVETHVAHTKLRYKGIIDCVAFYRGKLCLIDWKKSDKKKFRIESTYDAPLQVAAYIGALNSSEVYPFVIETGLVVIANADGSPANVHWMEGQVLKKYWRKWLLRLQQYFVVIDK